MTMHAGLYAAPYAEGVSSYCGPTAIAALTGKTVSDVETATLAYRVTHKPQKAVRRSRLDVANGKRVHVKTMWSNEIEGICERLGVRASAVADSTRYNPSFTSLATLAQFLKHARRVYPNARLLVLISGHYIAVCGDQWADSGHRTPEPITTCRYMRKRVRHAWIVTE